MYAPLIFKKLSEVSKTSDKIFLLQQHKDNTEFIELLQAAFNPYRVYGFKTVSFTPSKNKVQTNLHKEFMNLLKFLEGSPTNTEQREIVTAFLNKCDIHSQQLYADIICKNVRVGIQASLINKALGDLIPEFKVMLASPMEEGVEFEYPVLVQPKLDGVRCIIVKDNSTISAYTREGRPLHLPYIFKELYIFSGNFVLDGELLNFNNRLKTSGVVNKIIKGTASKEDTAELVFHAFDLLNLNEFITKKCTQPARARLVALERMLNLRPLTYVKCVPTYYAETYETVVEHYKHFRKLGEEGIIVKPTKGLYEYKRSKNWIKFKAIKSCTLRLIDWEKGSGQFENTVGSLICQSACGKLTVNVGSGLTEEDRDWFRDTDKKDLLIEVLYNELQQDLEGRYYLFLPRFKEIRWDKTEADTLEIIKNESEEKFK